MNPKTTPENRFKQALQAADGPAQIGLWLALPDSDSAELCATAGFDWLLIDGEHGPHDLRSMRAALQALAAYPGQPVLRLPQGDPALIKQALELGATTLLIPMVESADQACALVSACRYPPAGTRGVGSGLARSSRWSSWPNYLHEANARICLLVQAETHAAMQQIEAIAAVDGVDGIFIGPADLAASMGHLGQPGHPGVQALIDAGIARIKAAGKAAGIIATDEALARRYLQLGARFVAVGVDSLLLAQATRALRARFAPETAP